ncbi:MAG: hypothetical protein AB4911_10860 [Oscillochloridaceae bacterium umkhey_bin13]
MHDGYIFTLGVCGSAAGGGPAPACLDLMLAAIPPVKRAAYLGEVFDSVERDALDPLTVPVRLDLADAELLLLTTPLPGGALPPRLRSLTRALMVAPPPPRRRYAAIVAFADGSLDGLWPLRHALEAAEIEILGELYASVDADPATLADDLAELARMAYGRARAMHPEALP